MPSGTYTLQCSFWRVGGVSERMFQEDFITATRVAARKMAWGKLIAATMRQRAYPRPRNDSVAVVRILTHGSEAIDASTAHG
jgi:hypothetical protein